MSVLVHDDTFFLAGLAPVEQQRLQLFLRLFLLVAHLRRALEILVLDGLFLLAFDLLDLAWPPSFCFPAGASSC